MFRRRLSHRSVSWRLVCAAIFALSVCIVSAHFLLFSSAAEPKQVTDLKITVSEKQASPVHPITLQIVCRDEKTDSGDGGTLHQGTATYTFKNTLPIPVKLAFPPMGYTFGSAVPITPHCSDVKAMPEFCQETRVIELKSFATREFQSSYTIFSGNRPAAIPVRFVFGCPAGSREPGVLVDVVEAAAKFEMNPR